MSINPLNSSDTLAHAIEEMLHHGTQSLPVLQDGEFLGVVRLEDLENQLDDLQSLSSLTPELFRPAYVQVDSHELEVISAFGVFKCDVLAVLDRNGLYLGSIQASELLYAFAQAISFKIPGGAVVLELASADYHLSQIAQIAESGDARIVALYITEIPGSNRILLTIKLNKENLDGILQTFERYNYDIRAVFAQTKSAVDLMQRYNLLMKWINI
ncbi:CBS domain-containing protein [Thermaurantimonas aggregans]|uniref:CBS domain-containing protein n=1 Tax=Thermaurantimonas aggregans TaxID=2173829 RepID=UPI001358CC0B|nr:CBS domain-containing protein [Thermaurantimonas aggregans]MCX8148622.1 CBS domain-containing protein [Thermaurantimonas aggregans]